MLRTVQCFFGHLPGRHEVTAFVDQIHGTNRCFLVLSYSVGRFVTLTALQDHLFMFVAIPLYCLEFVFNDPRAIKFIQQ